MGIGAAIVAGAAISAGGAIAGGLLADDGSTPGANRTADSSIDTNPGLKVAEFNNLLSQGIFDPGILQQASPVNQLVAEMFSSGQFRDVPKSHVAHNLRIAMDWYAAGQPPVDKKQLARLGWQGVSPKTGEFVGQPVDAMRKLLDNMLAVSGYSSLDGLMAAQADFNAQIAPLLDSARGAAAGNFRARLETESQIRNLIGNLPDASAGGIAKLRAEEKSRLLRDLNRSVDEQRGDLLTLANAGNFNPGRPLGDLEEFRARSTQDADLEALNRALALIGGQQSAAGTNLSLLQGDQNNRFNQTNAIAAADQGLRGTQFLQSPNLQGNAALGTGISSGATSFGTGITQGLSAFTAQQNFDKTLAFNNKLAGFAP